MDCSRAIHDQLLKKVVIPLEKVAVFEPSEKSCWSSEKIVIPLEKKLVCGVDVCCIIYYTNLDVYADIKAGSYSLLGDSSLA